MSHTIYFYKKRELGHQKMLEIIEQEKSYPDGAISLKEFLDLKDKIKDKQTKKLLSASGVELNFENFQLIRYTNYIAFSIPYWKEHYEDKEILNFMELIDVFVGKGFGGYDPQVEMSILEEQYSFYKYFRLSLATVLGI